ncbi:related to SRC1 - regulation of cohesion (Splice variant I) [Cephalotrichum gorgonifer]|uniref:Related to SRC1 - regulation of cohesion (Splice variant I) n=1 Tax=Cephalotrichum gorgonifer TaxID=2041049 RepID=A0AAE8MR57_9PEZI|nr:related to SRC1 - regulation of cohesion (Splice variant I) [Cephalotrichum gorgonifer]
MSDSESPDYLQEDFDPRSMTVPRLRSILVKHNIQYPSTAKKSQLVELFEEEIVPQAKKILARHARAKRSSMGIVNAGADEDTHLEVPKSAARSRSPRKSATARVKSEELDEPLASPYSRSTRSSSRQLTQTFDIDTPRQSRRTVTPRIKSEEPEDEEFGREMTEESVFSSDNPFQSGSPPPSARLPKTPNGRRRTAGGESVKAPRSTRRRQTETPAYSTEEDERDVRAYERPTSNAGRRQTSELPDLDPGEEFTPEEQLELQQEWASQRQTDTVTRPKTRSSRRVNLATPLTVLFVSLLAAYGAWYRQEKIAVGYCGLGRPATQLLPPEVPLPDWAVPFVEPQCEPCPQHAYCYGNFEARCEPDFILEHHPLAAGGLIPLPPTCKPDGEKARRVKAVADKAVEELRERRAQFECGETTTEQGELVATPEVEVEELKETVSRKRNKRLNKQDFDDLWAAALGEVKDRDEVEVVEKTDSGGVPNTYLSSTSLARLPLTCAVKRSIVNGLERHRLSIGAVIAVIITALYARSRYLAERATAAKIPGLVDLVLDRLSKQKGLGEEDLDDPWLFLPNLRDDVLRSIHSLSARERIWKRVRAVVEQNSNVRTSQREGRNGEVGRAWEWIGPMSGDGARRRKSGRVSWGADVKTEDTPEQREKAHSKWEESRPIY